MRSFIESYGVWQQLKHTFDTCPVSQMTAQDQWGEAGIVAVNGHRFPVHPGKGDQEQSQWSVVQLWRALKSDLPLPLQPDPKEKSTLRFLIACLLPFPLST